MLTAPKFKIVQELIASSTKEELIWLNGYLAGIVAQGAEAQAATPIAAAPTGKITIAYGTETGNSKKLATYFATQAKKRGIHAKLVSLDQYRLTDLPKEEYFLTIISTQGEGEPPAAAKKFYDHIHQNGFRLNNMKYAILALGDTAYPLFCKAGEDVDTQLHKLGAERIHSLKKCDTDYEGEAGSWFTELLQKLNGDRTEASTAPLVVAKKSTGKKIYSGQVVTSINLNDRGSDKHTQHIELVADDLDYQPGDSIGVVPEIPTVLVEAILAITGFPAHKKISFRNEEISVFNLLRKKLNIVYLPERVIKKYSALVQQEIPDTKMGLLDLLKIYPVKDAAQFEEVLTLLEPITPRLYSISSSPAAHNGEVHITVAKDVFRVNDEVKFGLCSAWLTQLGVEDKLDFYIHRNGRFRLPSPEHDVIMIGPGTGIAPFRSFLAERDATGASGRNWLFFGDQHFSADFLYQTEIQNWLQTGVLTHIDVAFSRDQREKVYVQHKMRKQGAALFEWLESGAYLYICGAKDPMSVDVENSLLEIIREFGNRTAPEAVVYLEALSKAGRYLKDVY